MKILTNSLIMCALLIAISACQEDDRVKDNNWQLVWEDDFEGEAGALVDSTKWNYDIGRGEDGWGNQEFQYYTDRAENVSLDGEGNLAIRAVNESYLGASYTSARIKTQGVFEQAYGRFEARIKLPWGQGIWPAFWLLGANIDEVGWPQCGEIDIMEYRGQVPNVNSGSIHGPGHFAGDAITKEYTLVNDRFDLDFHVFAIEWGTDYISFFVDDFLYQQITPSDVTAVSGEWVYDHPFYIILNLAVGGTFVGSPNGQTVFPQTMLVDWVRVYQ